MKSLLTRWAGVMANVYHLDKDEKVSRHQHPIPHTTQALAGISKVQIYDGRPPRYMNMGDPAIELPPNIDHEIIACEDHTIVLNIVEDVPGAIIGYARAGGILLDTGDIV